MAAALQFPSGDGGDPQLPPDMSAPLRYRLTNECEPTWHWLFEGPETRQVDIPAGQTVEGELPPGVYTIKDWKDDGHTFGPNEAIGGDFIEVSIQCLDPDADNPPPPADSPPPDDSPPPP